MQNLIGLEMWEIWNNFHSEASCGCSVNIYATEVLHCFERQLQSGRSYIRSLFANEDQNRLGRDVIDTEVARRLILPQCRQAGKQSDGQRNGQTDRQTYDQRCANTDTDKRI